MRLMNIVISLGGIDNDYLTMVKLLRIGSTYMMPLSRNEMY